MKYIDHYGLVRMEQYTPVENGVLFRAYLDWWKMLNGAYDRNIAPILATKYFIGDKMYFQANPPQKGQHFSRDNMWGLYCLYIMNGLDLNELPNFKWNNEIWWHPNGWAVFLSLKNESWKNEFDWLVRLMREYSRDQYRKNPDDTSGTCLWAMMSYFLWGDLPNEEDIAAFRYYVTNGGRYDNADNPILLEIELYEELAL